jgi:hypothetical protein
VGASASYAPIAGLRAAAATLKSASDERFGFGVGAGGAVVAVVGFVAELSGMTMAEEPAVIGSTVLEFAVVEFIALVPSDSGTLYWRCCYSRCSRPVK